MGTSKYFLALSFLILIACQSEPNNKEKNAGPPAKTTKPWTRWWWHGSAVTKAGIKYHLTQFDSAGFGGVSIVPIYGVKGKEDAFIPYLSEKWQSMLQYTMETADSLGLGVDMTLGTGWPYGGPWIDSTHAAKRIDFKTGDISLTGQKVKRAAPGGNGYVMDHLNKEALQHHLQVFDSANHLSGLRAVFNDSYEVFGANWTNGFFKAFEKRRGYNLQDHLDVLIQEKPSNKQKKVLNDYRHTLHDLVMEEFAQPLQKWSQTHQSQLRSQAHGSPGNLLDIYAIADIPETEIFGSSMFNIPGVSIDEGHDPEQDKPNPLMLKFASSAAHVTGKRLVSSESFTWLGNHFKVALSQVKPEADQLFTTGINHIFYHGTAYSPKNAPWPGWRFYAATHFGPSSHLWPDLPALNGYISQTQQLLQNSRPDHDILLYFPVNDLWSDPGFSENLLMLTVHNIDQWLLPEAFGKAGKYLREHGYTFDYISDSQISKSTVNDNQIETAGASLYKTIIIPESKTMPVSTLEKLIQLSEKGANIIFWKGLPESAPGYHNARKRTEQLQKIIQEAAIESVEDNAKKSTGQGNILIADSLSRALKIQEIAPEPMAQQGLRFIRKQKGDTTLYFISNLHNKFQQGWITLAGNYQNVALFNPLSGKKGLAATRITADGKKQVYLQLKPGASCFLFAGNQKFSGNKWYYRRPDQNNPVSFQGHWKFQFNHAQDTTFTMQSLHSWTKLPVKEAQSYHGIGTYTNTFQLPENFSGPGLWLDLGTVRETAEVLINGHSLGKQWSVPFEVFIPEKFLEETNILEIRVRNLSANKISALEQKGLEWKNFYDINIVDISYEPFDAASWEPIPSGLTGPINLFMAENFIPNAN